MEKPWSKDVSAIEGWLSPGEELSFWNSVAQDDKSFRLAFKALVAAGCDKWVLLDTLGWIEDRQETRASPDDIRGIREGLEQGRLALSGLVEGLSAADLIGPGEAPAKVVREEWRLLHYSRDDADAALRILRDLSDQLKNLQRGADRRRNRVQDQYRAILVRYVKRKTGKPHDRLVCDLLNGVLALQHETIQVAPETRRSGRHARKRSIEEEFEYVIDDSWEPITVEAHRRWRDRNKKLIDEPPLLEEQWKHNLKRKAAERTEPKPQRLWPPTLSTRPSKKQKNR